jgi:predicted PurR-regulated permease PerM
MYQRIQRHFVTPLAFFILLGVFLFISVRMVLPYLLAIFMGAILAVLSHSVYLLLRKHGLSPKLAAFLNVILILTLVVTPLGWFATLSIRQGIEFGQSLAEKGSFDSILGEISSWSLVHRFIGDQAQIEGQIRPLLRNLGTQGSQILLGVLAALPDLILQAVLALISCFFFLIDGKKFLQWLNEKLPLDSDVRAVFYRSFKDTAISTIWATIAAASAQSTVMFFTYLALGVPGAFLATGATFIFAWIPLLGSTPIWLLGAVYLFVQDQFFKMALMLIAGAFTGVVDNFVRPLVLKGRGSMHPLVALVAIFGGIQMFGIFGVFFGPILAALLLTLINVWPIVASRSGIPATAESNKVEINQTVVAGIPSAPPERDKSKTA